MKFSLKLLIIYTLFLVPNLNLLAYQICLIPCDANFHLDEASFFKNSIWAKLKKTLNLLGDQLVLGVNPDAEKSDLVVAFNIPHADYLHLLKKDSNKNIIFLFEPPSVMPEQYDLKNLTSYVKIMTWKDDLVDNKRFFKFNLPIEEFEDLKIIEDIVPFDQKKFCTMITSNKASTHPSELYTERKKVINFFENNALHDFDLYGRFWPNSYKSYKGGIENKFSVLKHYKFAIAYENIHDIKGYISEKMLHCFKVGCVPIYWGASNVTDYIPESCFIDRRKFKSDEELYQFLKNISKEQYQEYLKNIKLFTHSPNMALYSWNNFIHTFINAVDFICE